MVTRRRFLQTGAIVTAGLMSPFGLTRVAGGWVAVPLLGAASHPKFQVPLPRPPKLRLTSAAHDGSVVNVDMRQSTVDLGLIGTDGSSLSTKAFGYTLDGSKNILGPTILAERDTRVRIRWRNRLPNSIDKHILPIDKTTHWAGHHYETTMSAPLPGIPTVTHLHGGHTRADSDGEPEAWFLRSFRNGPVGPAFSQPVYRYDNDQEAATNWYHDHALGVTRSNVFAGLAGFYLLTDGNERRLVRDGHLPAWGGRYDREIVVQDRAFTFDGQLTYPFTPEEVGELFDYPASVIAALNDPAQTPTPGITVAPEFFGDFMLVNGAVWPKLDVEPRKYRFRLLNGCDSRFLILELRGQGRRRMLQIAADQGFLPSGNYTRSLLLPPGARADVIVDFADLLAQGVDTVTLRNVGPDEPFGGLEAGQPPADTQTTGRVMRFNINQPLDPGEPDVDIDNTTALRDGGRFKVSFPAARTRKLALFEGRDKFGRLQPLLGVVDPTLRQGVGNGPITNATNGAMGWFQDLTELPALGDVEIWEVYNVTGDAHPVHIHLVAFEVLNRQKLGVEDTDWAVTNRRQPEHDSVQGDTTTMGRAAVLDLDGSVTGLPLSGDPFGGNPVIREPRGERAPLDIAVANPGEVLRLKMVFDKPGRYVWHCHILSHEDHEMMRPYQVLT
jgi:spore coat protein A